MLDRKAWYNITLESSSGSSMGHGHDTELSVGLVGEGELHIAGFFGVEALNELYTFDVVFSAGTMDGARVLGSLGQNACIRLPFEGGNRLFLGIASSIELVEPRLDSLVFHMEIVPRMWTLGRTKGSRVYQDMTTAAIVSEVLTRHGIPHRFALTGSYAKREYCLQYDESDLAFVLRLLADEGYAFTFEHLDDMAARALGFRRATECLIVGDDPTIYTPMPKLPPTLLYRPDAAKNADRGGWAIKEPVVRFSHRSVIGTNKVTHRDFDFTRAAPSPNTPHPSPPGTTVGPVVQNGAFTMVNRIETGVTPVDLEVYDHRAEENAPRVDQRRPGIRLQQLRGHTDFYVGSSWCRRFAPAKFFVLLDYPSIDPGEITLTRVTHSSHPEKGSTRMQYVNEFEAVKRAQILRPEAPPRRYIQTVETATVVGAPGQDVETEFHGRIKIQFHWDRLGKNDEHSSIWIRVAQPWSGPTYGFQFVPRIGHEVLVAFVGGDPDHPIVIGSLPNTANPLPHMLPQDATRSAIRSYSMPSTGGFNEVLFDDAAGSELFALRAERNHEVIVLQDHRLDVGKDSTTTIAGRRTARIAADDDVEVTGGSRRRVTGPSSDTVTADRMEAVGGSGSLGVKGNWTMNVGGVFEQTVAKNYRQIIGAEEPAEGFIAVNGEFRVAASTFLEVESEKRIRIVVGNSEIELTPEGIKVLADKLEMVVKDSIKTTSTTLAIAGKDLVEMQGKKVTATSDGASLVLESNASLDGSKVLLNCGGISPKSITDAEPPKKEKVIFRVEPPPGLEGPFTMVIQTPTGKMVELQTDGDNKVELEGDAGDKFTLVAVKKGEMTLHQHGGSGQ